MKNLYTSDGWIDAAQIVESPCPFVLAIGGRGIGKTYGVLLELYNRSIPFIYMRRTQSQLDAVTIPALNPFNQINTDNGYNVVAEKMGKYTVGFYNGATDEEGKTRAAGEPFAIGIALSTFASIRGMSAERFEVLLFDEIIPERHEKAFKEEELAFANALESLNRNRELTGRDSLKVIMLSNSNTLNSKIISALGCMDELERMTKRGIDYKVFRDDLAIFRYMDSPVSARKKNTALYRMIQNKDFQGMALDNDFSAADFEFVQQKPLAEYNMIVSVGNCTICKHKSNGEYYVIAGKKAAIKYTLLPLERKAFQKQYYYVWGAVLRKKVYFQSGTVKIEFERAWE